MRASRRAPDRRSGALQALLLSAVLAVVPVASPAWAQVDPEYTSALSEGRSAFKRDDFAAAEQAFRAALASASSPRQRANVHGLLALTLEKRGQPDAARTEAKRALDLLPDDARAREVMARLDGKPAPAVSPRQGAPASVAATPPPSSAKSGAAADRPAAVVAAPSAASPPPATAANWQWLTGESSEKVEVPRKDGRMMTQWVKGPCKVMLSDDLLRDIPEAYPKRVSAYRLSLMQGRCKSGLVHGYKAGEPYPITLWVPRPRGPGEHRDDHTRQVGIFANVNDGRLGDVVAVYVGELARADQLIGQYKIVDGRVVNMREVRAAEAGQKVIPLEDASGRIDVQAMRATGTILGLKLGANWQQANAKGLFKQSKVLYDKPCGRPIQSLQGLLGGHNAEVSIVGGRLAKVMLHVPSRVLYIKSWSAFAEQRYGKPGSTWEPLAFDKYAFYGSNDPDVRQHRVAPVTLYTRTDGGNSVICVSFNEVPLEKQYFAAIMGCRDQVGGAILGAAIGGIAKMVREGAKNAPPAGSQPSSADRKKSADADAVLKRQQQAAKGRFETRPDGKMTALLFNGSRIGKTFEDTLFHSKALGGGWKIDCDKGRVPGATTRSHAKSMSEALQTMQTVCKL